jgi:hypothetical protein
MNLEKQRSKKWTNAILLFLALLTSVANSVAQPTNDSFAHRAIIAGSWFEVAGNNADCTLETGEFIQGDKSLWWSWTPPTSGVYTLTAIGLPGYFAPFLAAYTGSSLSSLNLLASDAYGESDEAYTARVVINATGGARYPLAVTTVGGFGGGLTLTVAPTAPPGVKITSPTNGSTFYVSETVLLKADAFKTNGSITNVVFYLDFSPLVAFTHPPYEVSLQLTSLPSAYRFEVHATDNYGITTVSREVFFNITLPPPSNDDLRNRISLTGRTSVVAANNEYATREPGEQTPGDKSLWWSWTAPAAGTYLITATGLRAFYPFLGLYTGSSLSDLQLVASDSFAGSDDTYAARVQLDAVAGRTYLIAISTVGGIGGNLNLCITVPVSPDKLASFDSIDASAELATRLVFKTGGSSIWSLESSADFTFWEDTYLRFLPNGFYEVHDFREQPVPSRFYRLRSIPDSPFLILPVSNSRFSQ